MSISILEALKYCKKMSFQGSLTEKTPTGRFNRLTNQSVLSRFHTHPMRKIDDTGISLKESSKQKKQKKNTKFKEKNRNSGVFRQSIGPTKRLPQGKKQNWKKYYTQQIGSENCTLAAFIWLYALMKRQKWALGGFVANFSNMLGEMVQFTYFLTGLN